MKNLIFKLTAYCCYLLLLFSGGCEKAYDDSQLWEELRKLQSKQETMNSNLIALQNLVTVLESNDYVTSVTPFNDPAPGGYHFDFTKSSRVTISNGQQDGSPQIGAKQDTDGKYCWTLNGEWLPDGSGNKIPLTGENGATPQLRINPETNEWEICATGTCTDDANWSSTGVNAAGQHGDAIFAAGGVDNSNPAYVELTLADGVTKIKLPKYNETPRFLTFGFKASDNPLALLADVVCTIEENVVSVLVSHILQSKKLVPHFTFEGASVFIGDKIQESGKDSVDFSSPVEYTVQNQTGQSTTYTIRVSSFTGLPVVFINTKNNAPIASKDEYVEATIRIIEGAPDSDISFSGEMKIKGRGNSTWSLPKKPYKMKFDKKTSLLGEPKDKEWVLLANYTDKTSLRNETALFMGRLSLLEWTPRTHFVEVFLNEVYDGTYQLCEQIKIAEDRVNVTDDGYLLEVDQLGRLDPGDVYFQTTTTSRLFNIKEPDVENGSDRYNWIKNYVTNVEDMLYAENFDPETGYSQYVDLPSFVDWYLINEITKNNDAVMFSSCYLNIAPNGKLKMGPLWDFDIALGNVNYNGNEDPTGLWIAQTAWFQQFLKDPVFVAQVKERFAYFKSRKNEIFSNINSGAAYLKYSVVENNNRWHTLYTYTWPNYAVWGAYDNEVQYMKNWLDTRFDWLEQEFGKM